jgi:hypothetical protein
MEDIYAYLHALIVGFMTIYLVFGEGAEFGTGVFAVWRLRFCDLIRTRSRATNF